MRQFSWQQKSAQRSPRSQIVGQGDLWVIPFINEMNLHLMMVDRLSWIFVAIFALLAFMGGIYSMHNESWAEALASMAYAGSTISMVLAGDWVTLVFFWELMAVSSLYLIDAYRFR